MALVVEDGSGVVGAEAYASVSTASAYWSARPQDPNAAKWAALAGDQAKQEGSLRAGADYLDATWGSLYRGSRKTTTQGRLWPRVNRAALEPYAYESLADLTARQALTDVAIIGGDGLVIPNLPAQIVWANIEFAVRALSKPLAADASTEGWLKRRKVGPIEREWGGPGVQGGSYGSVDAMLGPILIGARNAMWNWL